MQEENSLQGGVNKGQELKSAFDAGSLNTSEAQGSEAQELSSSNSSAPVTAQNDAYQPYASPTSESQPSSYSGSDESLSTSSGGAYQDPSYVGGVAQNQSLPIGQNAPRVEGLGSSDQPLQSSINSGAGNATLKPTGGKPLEPKALGENNSSGATFADKGRVKPGGESSANGTQGGAGGMSSRFNKVGKGVQNSVDKVKNTANEVKDTVKDVGALIASRGTNIKAWVSLISKHKKVFIVWYSCLFLSLVLIIFLIISLMGGGQNNDVAQNPSSVYYLPNTTSQDFSNVFDPNYLMDDGFFMAKDVITEDQIRAYLMKKPGGKKLLSLEPSKFGYNPETGQRETRDVAKIIYDASRYSYEKKGRVYNISVNPIVLLAIIQKEQGLIKDAGNVTEHKLNRATGYACPDKRPCSPKYFGFSKQVYSASRNIFEAFITLKEKGRIANYKLGGVAIIDHQPVRMTNCITTALYRYTPHLQGNRLFWELTREISLAFGIRPMRYGRVAIEPTGQVRIKNPEVILIRQMPNNNYCNIMSNFMLLYHRNFSDILLNSGIIKCSEGICRYVGGISQGIREKYQGHRLLSTFGLSNEYKLVWRTGLDKKKGKDKESIVKEIRGQIDQGNPVAVGNMRLGTSGQHHRVIVGYNNFGWIYNDPAQEKPYSIYVSKTGDYHTNSYQDFFDSLIEYRYIERK